MTKNTNGRRMRAALRLLALPLPALVGATAAAQGGPHAGSGFGPLDAGAPEDASFAETRVEVPSRGVVLALRDLTGDGRQELIRVDGGTLNVRRLGDDGHYADTPTVLPWGAPTVGWDLVDLDGTGRTDLVLVADGHTVVRRRFGADGRWTEPETLFEDDIYLPAGVARVPFARDIDADGRADLVMPGPGRFYVHLNRGLDGEGALQWRQGLEIRYEPEIDYEFGNPRRLSSTFGQTLDIPLFSMRDVDGDGTLDLVSKLGDVVSFHLAQPEISAEPTWQLDLSSYKNGVSASDFDLDDLLSIFSGIADWRIADLDGEAPNDLVLSAGGTFQVFLNATVSGPGAEPDQVLNASGNVLHFEVRNVVGDGRPDLQILRGERVSLARLIKYLVVPGTLDFDVFTYVNTDGQFARRVTKRTTLALRVPRLLGLLDEMQEISDELEASWDVPATRVDWDGDGTKDDVVDAQNGELVVFLDCAPAETQRYENLTMQRGIDGLIEQVVLNRLDDLGDGDADAIDLGALEKEFLAPGKAFRDATAGRTPVARFPVWKGNDDRALRTVDLDGDGRLDVFTVVDGENTFRIQFLVRAGG